MASLVSIVMGWILVELALQQVLCAASDKVTPLTGFANVLGAS